ERRFRGAASPPSILIVLWIVHPASFKSRCRAARAALQRLSIYNPARRMSLGEWCGVKLLFCRHYYGKQAARPERGNRLEGRTFAKGRAGSIPNQAIQPNCSDVCSPLTNRACEVEASSLTFTTLVGSRKSSRTAVMA